MTHVTIFDNICCVNFSINKKKLALAYCYRIRAIRHLRTCYFWKIIIFDWQHIAPNSYVLTCGHS